MMFNSQKFLDDYNINYRTQGTNSSEGFINIDCVFCNDSNGHLGIHVYKGYSSCWKCGWHSIKDLIKKLLPYENTKKVLEKYDSNLVYSNKIHNKLNKITNTKIKLPGSELKPIHINYLKQRNYNPNYLVDKYKLQGTTHIGSYRYRIIIPVYYNHQLISYQTRALNNTDTRYINCDPKDEIIPIKEVLYNLDNCKKDYVVLTEGCFKVFRLGDNSCASLGKNYVNKQLNLLVNRFKIVYVFFDPDDAGQEKAERICNELNNLGVETYNISNDLAPDDMNQKEADNFMRSLE